MSARTRQPRSAVERLLTSANLPALGVGRPENRPGVVGVLAAASALEPGLSLAGVLRPGVQPQPATELFHRGSDPVEATRGFVEATRGVGDEPTALLREPAESCEPST